MRLTPLTAALILALIAALVPAGLKLAGIVGWPWIWTTAPLWLPALIIVLFFLKGELVYLWRRYGP